MTASLSDQLSKIKRVKKDFFSEQDTLSSSDLKNKYLGRNGAISNLMKNLSGLEKTDRPLYGKAVNELKSEMTEAFLTSQAKKTQNNQSSEADFQNLDPSLPGRSFRKGTQHPLTLMLRKITHFFELRGFSVAEGPEIESDDFNFTALNIAPDHPSRDMHDTFYFDANRLLRTHTSPVQIRVMKENQPPFRIIAPGKVYRCDSDVTHSPMFHQVEGLMVGKGVCMGHLKSLLLTFVQTIFEKECRLRFRASYFPFTEPSAEVDVSCVICEGKGCRTCSHSGWLEILGAGMVDPIVLSNVGVDPELFSGYAFGLGVERIAMLKYGIQDIRFFYENHLGFLQQFYASL